MRRKSEGLAQSVQTRLVRHAHDTNVDPNLVMARFASERFLYRLSRSAYVGQFVLFRATFERRRTAIPAELPIALTSAFAEVEGKRAQWRSFLRRNRLSAAPEDLGTAIAALAGFLGPVLAAARRGDAYDLHWRPGGPWAPARAQTS